MRIIATIILSLAFFSTPVFADAEADEDRLEAFQKEFAALVKTAQELLNEMGYEPGVAVDRLDEQTTEAIQRFQADTGRTVTGRISWELNKQLRASAASGHRAKPIQFDLHADSVHCPSPELIESGEYYPFADTGCAFTQSPIGPFNQPVEIKPGVVEIRMRGNLGIRYAKLTNVSADPRYIVGSSSKSTGKLPLKSEAQYQSDSKQICREEWTKRGELDSRMYNYCIEQQTEGYNEIRQQFAQYGNQEFFYAVSLPYCSSEWTERGVVNTRMLAYCLEQEIEGKKDVDYLRKTYGSALVDNIARAAIAEYNSWNMAAYSVKKVLE